MTGAKIILRIGIDAACNGLVGLAGTSWMMNLPQRRAAYRGHPAGRGRPGMAADGGTVLVAVTFGEITVTDADHLALAVGWEPVAPDDKFTVQLKGSIILAPATAPGCSALTMSGACQVPDGGDLVRLELIEASREFITSVARSIVPDAGSHSLGQSWAW